MRIVLLLAGLLLAGVLPATLLPAAAQMLPGTETPVGESTAPALPDPLTPESIRDRVSTMSDADARQLLVQVLDGLAAKAPAAEPAGAPEGTLAALRVAVTGIATSFLDTIQKGPNVVGGLSTALTNFVATHGWETVGTMLGLLAASILLGSLAEVAVNRLTSRWHDRIDRARVPESLTEMLPSSACGF